MTLPVVFTANGPSGYNLTNSLRFRSSASAYLNRTLTTPTSSQKFTWSGWIKRGKLDSSGLQGIFCPYSSGTVYGYLAWYQDGIRIFDRLSGGTNFLLQTTAVYRDPSAWYHIVYAVDTTQATAANRVRLYVNGVEVTAFSTSTYPTQNNSTTTNSAIAHNIGYDPSNTGYFDGYQTEINFVDGQQLTPSSFGQTSATTGVWQPIKYTGTYGTNGFYLPFTDNSALTTSSNVGLGKDFSGNSNYWTTNNISITSGATYDSMTDVPTLTNATTANYAVMNPLIQTSNLNLSNANLTINGTGNYSTSPATFGMSSGKWYWEYTCTTYSASGDTHYGIGTGAFNIYQNTWAGSTSVGWIYAASNGNKYNNNSAVSYGATFTTGDVIGVAFDADAGTLTFYKNNVSQGTAYTGLTSGPYFPVATVGTSNVTNANFGQRPFAYTPPTGFVALNTFNLPTPTIGATASTQANDYFNVVTWTGTGVSRNVTGVGFQPDFVWLKIRSSADSNGLFDAVRGAGKRLQSNDTGAEATGATSVLSAFISDGFTVGTDSQSNANGSTYVGWQWKANGTGSSNTQGTITSTVSANTSAGFSIVTYTGTGVTGTLGHGLGVAPAMIIVKSRSNASNWYTYHQSIGNTGAVALNLTDATITSANFWNNTSPTSSVFTASAGSAEINGNGLTYVAYCFAQIAGYSAFGSYTGNGSNDGTFVYTGFRPRYVMVKCSSSDQGGNAVWVIVDTARNTYNVANNRLLADSSATESTSPWMDITSNGFKIRETSTSVNGNGATYIYMAFAENPFKYSLAR